MALDLAAPVGASAVMAPPPNGKVLLRVAEASDALSVSRSTLYQLIQQGVVPVVRIGRSVRVPRQALERIAQTDGR
jgi:excisionase family DNA binding protein